MAFPRKNLTGKIGDKTIYDFTKNLDYNLNLNERLEEVQNRIYSECGIPQEYFQEVFNQSFEGKTGNNVSPIKLTITTDDFLYTDTNVCNEITKLADYLLYAYEDENPNDDLVDYKIITENKLRQMEKEERKNIFSLDEFKSNTMVFIKSEKNYKKDIKQVITKSDFTDDEKGKVLKDYQDAIDNCCKNIRYIDKLNDIYLKTNNYTNLEKLNEEEKYFIESNNIVFSEDFIKTQRSLRKKYRTIAKELKKDQLLAKDKLCGTIYFKEPLRDSSKIDYEQFDFGDVNHVKELLRVQMGENFDSDLGCLIYDLNNLIKKCEFTDNEKKILHLWRNTQLTQEAIGKILNIAQKNVSKTIDRIVYKIINEFYNQYECWYYLEIVRGKYKQCSKCGEVKLISNFSPKKDSKDGYHPYCRYCRK